jgi:hypothetical protein
MLCRNKKISILLGAVFLIFFIIEAIWRLTNIPGIDKNMHYIADPLVGYGHKPHTKLSYCNYRGDIVHRIFNAYGYLDSEHPKEKLQGIYRIGFFGDSFVDARQVRLEDTFFKLTEKNLASHKIECLAFGEGGGGGLIAYLNSNRWSRYFDIDLIVYVFYGNDMGDNIKKIKGKTSPYFPFAFLVGDGYEIDYLNRDKFLRYSKTFRYKIRKFLSDNFLCARVIRNRIKLLFTYGPRFYMKDKNRQMADMSKKDSLPDQNDLPSTWPSSLREYAQRLEEAILLKWKNEAEKDGKQFAILYIPSESEIKKGTGVQDSWKARLISFCSDKGIDCIDPTQDLMKMQDIGKEVFYDHLTLYGHEACAVAFDKWFDVSNRKLRH